MKTTACHPEVAAATSGSALKIYCAELQTRVPAPQSSQRERKRIAQGEVRRGGRNPGIPNHPSPSPVGAKESGAFSYFLDGTPFHPRLRLLFDDGGNEFTATGY